MADFFSDKPDESNSEEAEKIHVGDKEYTQEELNELVNLGTLSKDAEERYNTRLDKVYPKFTQTTQENAELKKRLADLEAQATKPQATEQQVDAWQQALTELESHGVVTNGALDQRIYTALEGRELRNETYEIVDEASGMGIETTPDEILSYMKDEDIRDPWRAFSELYGNQIDRFNKQQLDGLKPESLYTTTNSQAGAVRQPAPVKVTEDNIQELLREAIESE